MFKKLIYLFSVVLLLSLASASYGQVVIGNFEGALDGWQRCGWNPPGNATLSPETTGATLDSYSLGAVLTTDGMRWLLQNTTVSGDDFRANNYIAMDVTRLSGEWTRGDPNEDHWSFLSMHFQDNVNYNLVGLGEIGQWDSNDPGADNTMTIIWEYTYYKSKPLVLSPDSTSIQVEFSTNCGGYTGDGKWYFDNIRLLPGRNEKPRNGAWGVEINPILEWDEEAPADTFDIYFGTDFNDVNNATRAEPCGVSEVTNYDPNNYSTSGTSNSTTYYWRIDDVVGGTPSKGPVWHFTTFIPGSKITVIGDWEQQMDGWVATDPEDANMELGYSTAGATLNNYSLLVYPPTQWFNTVQNPIHETGLTDQLLSNNRFSLDVTWDTTEFTGDIESIIINGDGIGGLQLAPLSGTVINSEGSLQTTRFKWDYSAVDFSLLDPNAEITLSIGTMADGHGVYYFDNARLYNSKIASTPRPSDKETDVQRKTHLIWTSGEGAGTHDVYFGDDYDKVKDANRADYTDVLFHDFDRAYGANDVDITGYLGNPLTFDTPYYWRIDEVNVIIWTGDVWSFEVGHFIIADDFESYPLNPGIKDTWKASGGATVSISTDPVHVDAQAMAFVYDNNVPPYYSEANAVTSSLKIDSNNWTAENVKALSLWFKGIPDLDGSFTENLVPPVTYTIESDGWDIYGTEDGFHYGYKLLNILGDLPVSITARVFSVEDTHEWAKAGVMIRSDLDPNSTNVAVVLTPGRGVSFQHRDIKNVETIDEETIDGNVAPHWVRLTYDEFVAATYRFRAEHAEDNGGTPGTWLQIGEDLLITALPGDMYIGLCVTSHNDRDMCTAVIDHVTMTGSISGGWQSQDIGIASNDAELMYVILQDGDSNAIVYHDDLNVTLTPDWTEWRIDLNDFTGVQRDNVQKMYIGFGDCNNPTQNGTGTVYIDDIRLYQADCSFPVDLVRDCSIDYADLNVLAENWLQIPYEFRVNLYGGQTIDFRDIAELAKYWGEEGLIWPTW